MMLDYHSLLLALGVSSACLMVTLLGTWISRRADSFLFTLVMALSLLVAGIFTYSSYTTEDTVSWGMLSYCFMMAGFSTTYAGSIQFQTGKPPWKTAVLLSTMLIALGAPLFVMGFDGVGIILLNIAAAGLLIGTGFRYYAARHEALGPLCGMAVLYILSGLSFALCAAVLIDGRQWVLGRAPDNWAETINIGVCIAGMTGIGALSLALHQWRIAAHHRREAMTDPLTGLLNRRALFEQHGDRLLHSSTAVVVFDIDRFKSINDRYGHATGDLVIRLFAEDLVQAAKSGHTVARLGGEEFAMILSDALPGRAERVANEIARKFASRKIMVGEERLQCTVSAGVAVGTAAGQTFETSLNLADNALYEAKRGGRNRVAVADYLRPVEEADSRTTA